MLAKTMLYAGVRKTDKPNMGRSDKQSLRPRPFMEAVGKLGKNKGEHELCCSKIALASGTFLPHGRGQLELQAH